MTEQVRGCHHCIGAGFTVANLAFQFLRGSALSKGALSAADIAELQDQFLASFAVGFKLFEEINRKCTNASASANGDPFSRVNLLASLLSACGSSAAKRTFKTQISACDTGWLDDFFSALAKFVRENVKYNIDALLMAAFVEAAGKHKSNLTVSKLLQEEKVRGAMKGCISALSNGIEKNERAEAISAGVNKCLSDIRHTGGARAAKTTASELQEFLKMLSNQGETLIKATAA